MKCASKPSLARAGLPRGGGIKQNNHPVRQANLGLWLTVECFDQVVDWTKSPSFESHTVKVLSLAVLLWARDQPLAKRACMEVLN